MRNNLHLVPQVVLDIAESMMNKNIKENEYQNYVVRMEAIRDFCTSSLNTYSKDKRASMDKDNAAKMYYSKIGKNNV